MVKLNRIYTRSGDSGETGLADGARRPKHDARIAAIGAVDEANAAIGVARLHVAAWQAQMDAQLQQVQHDLFDIGADLAFADAEQAQGWRLDEGRWRRLEAWIDAMNAELAPLTSFVLPAGCAAAAHLHVARAVVRRAERDIAVLAARAGEWVNPQVVAYVNRLSDHLFVMARLANHAQGEGDVLWRPLAQREQETGEE